MTPKQKKNRKLAAAANVKLKFAISKLDEALSGALADFAKFDDLTNEALGLVDLACAQLEKIES